jgi:hypothetical protein
MQFTDDEIETILKSKDKKLIALLHDALNLPLRNFEPRPDQPELYDQQTSFLTEKFNGIACCLGGTGCLAGWTELYDPIAEEYCRLDQIAGPFHVHSLNEQTGQREIALASKPFVKGIADLYEFTLSNGCQFVATLAHRVLCAAGQWLPLKHVLSEPCPLRSSSGIYQPGFPADDRHCSQTGRGFQWHCCQGYCQCDAQLQGQTCRGLSLPLVAKDTFASCPHITKVRYVKKDRFYDLTVAKNHNYELSGVWHHNSGKSIVAAAKMATHILETPPPRPMCPIWIIGPTFDKSIGTCWQTHMSRFIPRSAIAGYTWYSQRQQQPLTVILKNDAHGNNWVIEMKSGESEQEKFEASSIGGFWIDEQISPDRLGSIWARCRDYHYPGSQIYSLTPLRPDPYIEQIYENQERYTDWKFYRMNGECNDKVAPGAIRRILDNCLEEEREARRIGAFSSYYGSVYKSFNPAIHVIQPRHIPDDWPHFRGLDFGYNHPTVCIFAARDREGRYYVYDEYFRREATIEEHVEAIKAKSWNDNWMTYADYGGLQERAEFRIRGLPNTPAKKDIKAGINVVQQHLKLAADGKPKLYISRDCTNLIRELRTYQWHEFLDKPVDKDNHCVDALRYILASEFHAVQPWNPVVNVRRPKRRVG